MNWEVRAQRLAIGISERIKLDGLAASLQTRGQTVSVTLDDSTEQFIDATRSGSSL